jgi:hypothetical protein
MNPFKQEADVEISATSGTLRVTVHPKPNWFLMLVEVAVVAFFVVSLHNDWHRMTLLPRGVWLWAIASAVVAWFYQLSGSEIIEFDAQKLTIRKDILGWQRTREYSIEDCHELEWREEKGKNGKCRLQCKVGWRTVTFGEYVSDEKAIEVLTVLQGQLPDLAQKLLVSPDFTKKHFTTLNLS